MYEIINPGMKSIKIFDTEISIGEPFYLLKAKLTADINGTNIKKILYINDSKHSEGNMLIRLKETTLFDIIANIELKVVNYKLSNIRVFIDTDKRTSIIECFYKDIGVNIDIESINISPDHSFIIIADSLKISGQDKDDIYQIKIREI